MKRRLVLTNPAIAGMLLAILVVSLSACGGKALRRSSEPDWVQRGSGAFVDQDQKSFYGVGAIVGVKNKPLARTAADNRARAEITKIFETYSASLMRDYAASTTSGSFEATSEEQNIEQSIKTFSAATLSGVVIIDHWADTSDGVFYSLARLDLERFRENINKAKELNASVRDFVKQNAEKAFEKLEAEEAKRR
ncbi:MAG: LPP20 family lipoprotein [Nitrospiria bacterium]